MITAAFAEFRDQAWPITFDCTLHVKNIIGGIPSDPAVGEGFIRSKLQGSEDLIRQLVAATMEERGITADQAAKEVDQLKHLNGFKRDEDGLYIEGRQFKAALKEAASVAYASGKLLNKGKNSYGRTSKGIHGFLAEHVCVVDDRIYLGRQEPDMVLQKFVHTFRGSGIQYEECVEECDLDITVKTDWEFSDEQWAMILLTGEEQGIGASRSQGFGRYTVTRWDQRK
jgi:hypothetical protein